MTKALVLLVACSVLVCCSDAGEPGDGTAGSGGTSGSGGSGGGRGDMFGGLPSHAGARLQRRGRTFDNDGVHERLREAQSV